MSEILSQVQKMGIVSIISLEDAADAIPVARALMAGGLYCAEVTFRTDAAESAIKQISDQIPEMLIGAGTILTKEQADRAIAARSKIYSNSWI